MKDNQLQKKDFFILFFIILLGLFLRLYKINTPLADFHSWRQADTAAVARNFIRFGFDLFHPRYDDLSSIPSGIENPQGYRMVEFPIYNFIVAFLTKNFGFFSLEIWGRLTTIFFSLITLLIIYYFSLREIGRMAAFFSGLTFAIMPFFVFYSRTILPETTAVSLTFLSIFFIYLFSKKEEKSSSVYYLFSLFFFAISLLTKPTAIFYSIVISYFFIKKDSIYFLKKIYFYLYFILSFLPLILWRLYILNYPEGIPANEWLITSVNTSEGLKNIFFRPAFFRWIFFERINISILGGYLLPFFILGLIRKLKNNFLLFFNLSIFSYLFTFQGGNTQHEYYQIIILPVLALNIGSGIDFFFQLRNKFFLKNFSFYLLLLISFIFSFIFSYEKIRFYYHYPQDLITIANIVKKITKPEDKIVTDRQGDTTLLYLMERRGAPAVYKKPDELKKLGYQYLLTQNMEYFNVLKKEYQVIFETNNFGLIKL